jgi:gamma-tubulin complex component 2
MTLDGPDSMAASTLTGLEAFSFEYEVRFPLSLIISRKSLKRYQLLFRHLLHCRHVERTLGMWLSRPTQGRI